jgi:thiamine biosynthesis lipoprotein
MRRCQALLGTYVEIMIPDQYYAEQLNHAFHEAFQEIQLIERLMSFRRPSSDLSQINQYAFQRNVAVHPYTYEVLSMAKQLFHETKGAFDCSIGFELQNWGLLPQIYEDDFLEHGTLKDLELKMDSLISFGKPLCLDLGGISKGYAVDKAIESLARNNITEAVINAGGDMRVLGESAEDIYIKHPVNLNELIHIGRLSNGAIATSGIYYSKETSFHQNQSALVIPCTDQSVLSTQSYSVVAKSCMVADGLTKALAIHQDVNAQYLNKYDAIGMIL